MANWRSRLIVSFTEGGVKKTITPIDSFQPSFSLNAEPLHSIEATHIGVIYSPDQVNFSMTVKAVGANGAAARLTHLALSGTPFNVEVEVRENDEDDWAFESLVLADCIITNATPTNASISGAPTATFSGFAMAGTAKSGATESKAGAYGTASSKVGVNA
jgi:hypothetical protein